MGSLNPLVLALRNPRTQIGEQDGAWVYMQKSGHGLACLYDSGRDWLSRPHPTEALTIYNKIKEDEGWRPMTPKDLEVTCGIDSKW